LRYTPEAEKLLAKAVGDPEITPETVLLTYQCARRLPDGTLCNELVDIKLRHWREMP
jgi:hypothetical protein